MLGWIAMRGNACVVFAGAFMLMLVPPALAQPAQCGPPDRQCAPDYNQQPCDRPDGAGVCKNVGIAGLATCQCVLRAATPVPPPAPAPAPGGGWGGETEAIAGAAGLTLAAIIGRRWRRRRS